LPAVRDGSESLAADAEVRGDDRDAPTAIDARSAGDANSRDPDLTPLARKQVRQMRRTRDPPLHRTPGAQTRRGPDEVLARRPVRVAARRIEVPNALPALHAAGRGMTEVAEPTHLERVPARRPVERRRLTQRDAAVPGAKPVDRGEHLPIQRLEARLRATRRECRVGEERNRDQEGESEGEPKSPLAAHAHTDPKCNTAVPPSLTNTTRKG